MQIALTDATVRTLKPGRYFDEKLPAFGIRVGKHLRTWIAMKGQNRQTITLGHYPSISLQDARRKAMAAFVAPDVAKSTITFAEAKQDFLALDRWRPGSKRVLTSNLGKFPWKGQLAKVTHEQVIEALDGIEGKSARWHAKKDITTFFNWCVPRYLASSPAAGIRSTSQPTRDRVLSDDELMKVWKAAEQMGQFGLIVKLLILTGQRRSEIGSLKWEYLKGDTVTLPRNATKNGHEHTFPISVTAVKLLITISNEKSGYIFRPARDTRSSTGHFNSWSKSHAALLKLSETSGWTPHDARRTFATNLAALKVRQEVAEKLLNHVSGTISGVAAIYNRHSYFEEMKAAIDLWEAHLLTLVAQPSGCA